MVAFDYWGLFTFDGSVWTNLGKAPKTVTSWGDKLVFGYSDWGLFTFDGSS